MNVKVGDVVADVHGEFGMVMQLFDNHTMRKNMVMVLWYDGLLEHCDISFLKVISETG